MKRLLGFLVLLLIISGIQPMLSQAAISYPTLYHTMYLVQTPMAKQPQNYQNLLFAPLGWSKDGKFAYMISRDPGGAGFEEVGFFEWRIQDLNTDKILWQSKRGLEPGLPQTILHSYDEIKAFQWIYSHLLETYQPFFNQYKITMQPNLRLTSFPLQYNNAKYYASVKNVSRVTKYDLPGAIGKYRILVTRNGLAKTVKWYKEPHDFLLDAQVVGYFRSPYEPRIAIAIGHIRRGWEGPPHPIEVVLSGCRLDKGFMPR